MESLKPLKDFTEEQATIHIINSYSNESIAFIKVLLSYWSGKHQTQVYFRNALKELLKKKRVYPLYMVRTCRKGAAFKTFVSIEEYASLSDALNKCDSAKDEYDVEIWCYQNYNAKPHAYLRTIELPSLSEIENGRLT